MILLYHTKAKNVNTFIQLYRIYMQNSQKLAEMTAKAQFQLVILTNTSDAFSKKLLNNDDLTKISYQLQQTWQYHFLQNIISCNQ